MQKTAIIGSGFIGRAWAISFARAGYEVSLWDQAPDAVAKAQGYIADVLADLERNDLLNGHSPDEVLARIVAETDLAKALDGAIHIQENTPENIETKIKVFSQLDEAADPSAVIASSTSALLPSRFTEHLKYRHRCLVVHPINPPYLIPAAEVVPAPWTSAEVVEQTRSFLVAAGHAPLVMKRELDGFIMNRMQGALLEEAFRLVADGYATVEDVDIGIRDGLALRWSFMGPFETIDLNAPGGVRDYVERYQVIYERLFPQMQRRVDWAGEVLRTVEAGRREKLPKEKLAERQVWRDRRLMALAAHKKKSTQEFGQ
ncbi:3-hydroxyacyl-CoA dehydrogenase [Phyllobacterium zundukense]|uniref:3-hydroxyacyl-CoA dehydrogenase n=1 Tax=Phyllobacterium zundukense TaxID=1867719 RepID=A0A2N9VXS8_9HYPH|nr:3-hydroxyacyl-CoA dehydrogenase [Phyllobacterium zundukense]ATU95702.1 3-hydroxyacyl-CoA dehydrogenase [Phyllobacterium zundukense]PIO44296.1 3-hydroxyacyl-CoA dehydrogenase [Phyllobacterium zundukense]